eukprot:m.5555 g.5555  ORF g.5555 m.5555 type:complete len:478 (-) comp5051_c0_seq1:192-1625(-)
MAVSGGVLPPSARIAVIGAGAAGLIAARWLKTRFAQVTVYEQASSIGGTWLYSPEEGHSSMYQNLRTNLPAVVMGVREHPFLEDKASPTSYVSRQRVLEYLEQYVKHHHLLPLIQFGCTVEVQRGGDCKGWRVVSVQDSANSGTNASSSSIHVDEQFDGVVVCNGHYTTPIIPHLEGIERFRGMVLHSHSYRTPDAFFGQRVVVLGAGQSGLDISQELHELGIDVVLSRFGGAPDAPYGTVPCASHVEGVGESGQLVCEDGTELACDTLLYCTGYAFTFPLGDGIVQVSENGRVVDDLYHQLLSIENPTLALLGLPTKVIPFPMFDTQAQWLTSLWAGDIPLPSEEDMYAEQARQISIREQLGWPTRYRHIFSDLQWEYSSILAKEAGIAPPEQWRRAIYEEGGRLRREMPLTYKLNKIHLVYQEMTEASTKEQDPSSSSPGTTTTPTIPITSDNADVLSTLLDKQVTFTFECYTPP